MKKLASLAITSLLMAAPAFADGANDAAARVNLTVKLMEAGKVVSSAMISALEGQAAQSVDARESTYVAEAKLEGEAVVLTPGTIESGFFVTMTPAITREGKIEVAFVARKSEVTSIKSIAWGGVEVQSPQVSSIGMEQKVVLEQGREVSIPFGSINANGPELVQYVLKIAASTAPVQVVSKD